MSTRKPRYNAYKPVMMTDGIQTWVRDTFDMSKPMTADDLAKFKEDHGSPKARITAMQARLDALKNVTPEMRLHVDAIRAIYASMPHALTQGVRNNAEWLELRHADELWAKIMILRDVMPLARMGREHSQSQSQKAQLPRKRAITDDGEDIAITDIIASLALREDELGDYLPHDELWGVFFAELDRLGLDPSESADGESIKYRSGSIARKRFANAIGETRKKNKSR